MMPEITLNYISGHILDAAIEVHKNLGPGLLESIYESCLEKELKSRNLKVSTQVEIPVVYKGEELEQRFRIDMLVENLIIVELKSVETTLPIHKAQLLSYLKLTNRKIGILINFNTPLLKDGFKRYINKYYIPLSNY